MALPHLLDERGRCCADSASRSGTCGVARRVGRRLGVAVARRRSPSCAAFLPRPHVDVSACRGPSAFDHNNVCSAAFRANGIRQTTSASCCSAASDAAALPIRPSCRCVAAASPPAARVRLHAIGVPDAIPCAGSPRRRASPRRRRAAADFVAATRPADAGLHARRRHAAAHVRLRRRRREQIKAMAATSR